jgi:hypothetical protein
VAFGEGVPWAALLGSGAVLPSGVFRPTGDATLREYILTANLLVGGRSAGHGAG